MNTSCFTFPPLIAGHAAWVAEPSYRGTSGIALLCFSTSFICIWSAVHRDIPPHRQSTFRSLLRDTPLFLVALFAPELMTVFAIYQFATARHVTVRVNRFTLVHGFYSVMGGFAFTEPIEFSQGEPRRIILTVSGVMFFMKYEPDLIPDLTLASITDRSKSSGLGKALLVTQVLWFCLNCASRFTEQLPLSLLELSTLAHSASTLSSYVMWWAKPLSIKEPTRI
ncbi:hypothetical protein SCHPADRAFT_827044, partial [Schizopora paradoxa]